MDSVNRNDYVLVHVLHHTPFYGYERFEQALASELKKKESAIGIYSDGSGFFLVRKEDHFALQEALDATIGNDAYYTEERNIENVFCEELFRQIPYETSFLVDFSLVDLNLSNYTHQIDYDNGQSFDVADICCNGEKLGSLTVYQPLAANNNENKFPYTRKPHISIYDNVDKSISRSFVSGILYGNPDGIVLNANRQADLAEGQGRITLSNGVVINFENYSHVDIQYMENGKNYSESYAFFKEEYSTASFDYIELGFTAENKEAATAPVPVSARDIKQNVEELMRGYKVAQFDKNHKIPVTLKDVVLCRNDGTTISLGDQFGIQPETEPER